MVSSSLDKSIKKALAKDPTDTGSAINVNISSHNNLNLNTGSGGNFVSDVSLPSDDKIQLLFPKCRPRSDYQQDITNHTTTDLISIDSSSTISSQSKLSSNTTLQLHSQTQQASSLLNSNKQMKLQSPLLLSSPDHNNKKHPYVNNNTSSEQAKLLPKLNSSKPNETANNYVETNPFRIGSNNRYFYAQQNSTTDSLLFNTNKNNNSAMAAASNTASSSMHHYHYPTTTAAASSTVGYYPAHSYFLEPDEIEHNPYMVDMLPATTATATASIPPNTIPSSILKTSPPDTPPALQPCTTPVDQSPLGSSRNLWDLSPIKSTTPTRIKTQSPSPTIYSRPHRGSYKKLLASPVPIEEDLETGHYYYNNKKPYYQAPQTDSDSANEPATFNDVHETERVKPKLYFSKSKIKHSETSDAIYAEVRKERCKDEQQRHSNKIVKSKSGSGIMEYDGSPRRFGMASNDDVDYYMPSQSSYKYGGPINSSPSTSAVNGPLINYSTSSSPPRPGFPQRVLSSHSASVSAPNNNPLPKSYSFDDRLTSSSYGSQQQPIVTATSTTLIPTTFIKNSMSAYELLTTSHDKTQQETIVEEEPEIMVDTHENDDEDVHESANMIMVMPEVSTACSTTTTNPVTAIADDNDGDEKELQLNSDTANVINSTSTFDMTSPTENLPTSTFDYLYEFSETRKVLEEFFKCPDDKIKEFEKFSDFNESDDSLDIQYDYRGQIEKDMESLYGTSKKVSSPMAIKQLDDDSQLIEEDIDDDNRDDKEDDKEEEAYVKAKQNGYIQDNQKTFDYYLDTVSRSSIGDDAMDQDNDLDNLRKMTSSSLNNNNNNSNSNSTSYQRRQSKNFNYSPDTTDYDSESSMRFIAADYPIIQASTTITVPATAAAAAAATVDTSGGPTTNTYTTRYCTSMPVLEDGLSSGHASDNENNNSNSNNSNNPLSNDLNSYFNKRNSIASSISTIQKQYQENLVQTHASNNILYNNNGSTTNPTNGLAKNTNNNNNNLLNNGDIHETKVRSAQSPPSYHPYYVMRYDNTSSKDSMRHDDNTVTATTTGKDTLRYDNGSKEMINRYESKEPLMNSSHTSLMSSNKIFKNRDPDLESLYTINTIQLTPPPPAPVAHRQILNDAQFSSPQSQQQQQQQQQLKQESDIQAALKDIRTSLQRTKGMNPGNSPLYTTNNISNIVNNNSYYERTPVIPEKIESPAMSLSPVWIPRSSRDKNTHSPNETGSLLSKHKNSDDEDEEEIDTDLETDRLLGHQMLDDGFYDDKTWSERKQLSQQSQQQNRSSSLLGSKISPKVNQNSGQVAPSAIQKSNSSTLLRHGLNTLLPTSSPSECCVNNNASPASLAATNSQHASATHSLKTSPATMNSNNMINLMHAKSSASPDRNDSSPRKLDDLPEQREETPSNNKNSLNNNNNNIPETNDLCNLDNELVDSPGGSSSDKSKTKDLTSTGDKKKKNKNKEVLIEGVLFRARYLGSTQLVCEGQPTKSTRMMQAEEAVSRIKALAPDGENQPSTEVDLFISTEKIMVLNTDLKEIMMDHALRTISYIADIGDLVVLMARRRFVPQDHEVNSDSGTGTGGSGNVSGGSGGPTPPTSGKINRTPKMICHVFESEEAQFIAQSIGQAFQVAYMEFLKANGIEDHSFMKEMDYQEVLNSQEIFGDELEIFAKKELQKEVVVPKAKGEILGVVIVESGWGSMLPTVVIANLASNGAAARCGQLNIGDQIIAINGLSLVGLPLSQCQQYIKNTKNQTVVKFTVVPCAPVVEVKIKRPNTKYQLGFSVQNGVICSLLRGGIAERGGVRVGHRIIEINNQSVVAVPHEKIVNLLATSVGEILMKTMPTSMFRLLTGQENPIYI